jgi:putative spermidine/putrescine transport system ATP-binding protein
MTALAYVGIRKTFGTTVALEHFDLELHEGELVSLLGPSGCGKTTALRIAAGFEFADSGAVMVAGRDITRTPAHRRNMGMVFQSYSLFPNLTVELNVDYGLRTRKFPKAERARRVARMLDLVQLTPLAKRYPHQLSGGQQQRVALARALAVEPRVLLLDEPLSALDAKVRATLRDEIRRIQTELGITTLFVTHDQEEALAISDRIGVMSDGRLEQLGDPTEVYRHPATAFVARFVGSMNELPATARADGGVDVAGVGLATPDRVTTAAGTALLLLVRPEDVGLAVLNGDGGGLRGTVVGHVFAGPSTLVKVRVDTIDALVTANVPGAAPYEAGDRVALTLDTARGLVEPAPERPSS